MRVMLYNVCQPYIYIYLRGYNMTKNRIIYSILKINCYNERFFSFFSFFLYIRCKAQAIVNFSELRKNKLKKFNSYVTITQLRNSSNTYQITDNKYLFIVSVKRKTQKKKKKILIFFIAQLNGLWNCCEIIV